MKFSELIIFLTKLFIHSKILIFILALVSKKSILFSLLNFMASFSSTFLSFCKSHLFPAKTYRILLFVSCISLIQFDTFKNVPLFVISYKIIIPCTLLNKFCVIDLNCSCPAESHNCTMTFLWVISISFELESKPAEDKLFSENLSFVYLYIKFDLPTPGSPTINILIIYISSSLLLLSVR